MQGTSVGFRDRGRGFNVLSVYRLTLPDEAWRKEGRHSESGRYTAEDWLRIYADHLQKPARQIERNLEAWQERAGERP
jgi:hypothetical protein